MQVVFLCIQNFIISRDSETGRPGVAFFLVGDRHDSRVYIRKKSEACTDLGINHFTYEFPSNIDEKTILEKIEEINERNDIHGLIVQVFYNFNKIILIGISSLYQNHWLLPRIGSLIMLFLQRMLMASLIEALLT